MNKALIFAVIALSTAGIMSAQAQTYRWKDASGKIVISDSPPPASIKDQRSIGVRQPNVVLGKSEETATDKPADAIKAPDAPKTMAEKDADFKKRQQEAKEKATKDAQAAAAERDRKSSCEAARNNLKVLDSGQAVNQYDENGKPRALEGQQRNQERERTLRIMQEACK